MAVLTRERFSELIGYLRDAQGELGAKHPEVSSTLAEGTDELERLVAVEDLETAERSAKRLWTDLLEFPVIRSVFPTMAPGYDPEEDEPGLEQTTLAIEKFNDAVKEIGGLFR
jgi:hypothetical protein